MWLKEKMRDLEKQERIKIEVEDHKCGIRRISNWKVPGPNGVYCFWYKKLTNVHGGTTKHLRNGMVPHWLTVAHTVLIMKDRKKLRVASNYRPIACLQLMLKLMTGILQKRYIATFQTRSYYLINKKDAG